MKIIRVGSAAYHGTSTIEFNPVSVRYSQESGVVFYGTSVRDFSTKAHHDYHACISVQEVVKILGAVAAASAADAPSFTEALGPAIKSLVQLLAVATSTSITTPNG